MGWARGARDVLALTLLLWAPWRATPVVPAPAPLRLSATLAEDASLASFNLQFGDSTILSPDGTVVAFVGQKADGVFLSSMFGDSTSFRPRRSEGPTMPSARSFPRMDDGSGFLPTES